ncbi:MAG: VOC family protein [Solirubrobacterales bacterium]|nr:VOC family protein [Solirubrobacterales bacterium]
MTGPQPMSDALSSVSDGARPTVHQIASLVHDLDSSVNRLKELMGWGPWEVYDYVPGRLRELTVRGERTEFTWVGAEAQIGTDLYVELLQPTSETGILYEWLTAHGEGVHHVGYWAPDIEAAEKIQRHLLQAGTDVLLSAWIDDVYFYYMDTRPMIYEVWAGDLETLAPVRRIDAPPAPVD